MLPILYAAILLFFWLRALRITPERYPNASPENVELWRAALIVSYKRYAIFFFVYIALSLGLSFLQNQLVRENPNVTLTTAPEYFKLASGVLVIYILGCLAYIAYRAVKHHLVAKQMGIYA